jgi:hypothetical protein
MGKVNARKRPNALEPQAELAQFIQAISQFFNQDLINAHARETGFVERESKLTGHLFLSIFTFGMTLYGTPSLNQLAGLLNEVLPHLEITRQGLSERITEEAVVFFEKMVALALELELPKRLSEELHAAVCPHFNRILIFDSTSFQLPDALAPYFRGLGGDGPKAAVKILFGYDFKSCQFLYCLREGTAPDQLESHGFLEDFRAGDLEISDLAFFNLRTFAKIAQRGAFYLSRLLHRVTLYQRTSDSSYEEFNLVKFVQKLPRACTEVKLYFKTDGEFHQTRVIIEKVPEEVKARRLRKVRKRNLRKGSMITKRTKVLSGFNLYLTNAPAAAIPTEYMRAFYGVRWQVELTFKSWKSHFALAKVTGKKPERIRCLLYAKLLFITVATKFCTAIRNRVWLNHNREVSIDQALKHLKIRTQAWLKAIVCQSENVCVILQRASAFIAKRCLKGPSRKRTYPLALLEKMVS